MSPWNYPGGYIPGAVSDRSPRGGLRPQRRCDRLGRSSTGASIKYFAGVYDLGAPAESPLFSGRLNLSLGNPEPGYYHSSTYYGGRDVAAIGVNAQYKKNGSLAPPPIPPDDGGARRPPTTPGSPPTSCWSAPLPAARHRWTWRRRSTSSPATYEPVDYHYYAPGSAT